MGPDRRRGFGHERFGVVRRQWRVIDLSVEHASRLKARNKETRAEGIYLDRGEARQVKSGGDQLLFTQSFFIVTTNLAQPGGLTGFAVTHFTYWKTQSSCTFNPNHKHVE